MTKPLVSLRSRLRPRRTVLPLRARVICQYSRKKATEPPPEKGTGPLNGEVLSPFPDRVFGKRLTLRGEGALYKNPPACAGEKAQASGFRRQHGGHPFPLHRGWLLDLGNVGQLLQHGQDDSLPFVDVLQLAAAEQYVEQHLVVVFEELAGLVDLGFDVVLAGLGANANLLELLLVDL